MKVWLKYCKKCRMGPDEFLLMILEFSKDIDADKKKAEIFKYIYRRNRAENPELSDSRIQDKMCKKFNIGLSTLYKYIYWK